MSVGSWDPADASVELNTEVIDTLLAAFRTGTAPGFGLSDQEIARLAAFARHRAASVVKKAVCDWGDAATTLTDEQIVELIRLYTQAESLPGWEAGAASPVIPLAKTLKSRGVYPAELTRWIKANSDNRFLPYGSLMDRL